MCLGICRHCWTKIRAISAHFQANRSWTFALYLMGAFIVEIPIHDAVLVVLQWQNGRRFADDIFKCIFLNENARISLKITLKFVHKVQINNIPALVQIMAWRRPGDKPLSEPMMVSLLTHICVTRPQWVKPAKCLETTRFQRSKT